MYLISITNNVIHDLIESLTLNETSKNVLKHVILRYDHSYINFVYCLFSVYLKPYVRLNSDECHLCSHERLEVLQTFNERLPRVNYDNIFIADKFDVLFGVSPYTHVDSSKFSTYLYEDMYNRIENITGVEIATEYMEDVFESIEYIVSHLESSIVRLVNKEDEESTFTLFRLHLDILDNHLFMAVY